MTEENVDKIIDTYKSRKIIDKYSNAATLEEIKENDYNLNTPRYIETFVEEEPVDLEVL